MADAEQRISPEMQNISPEEEFPSSEKPIAMEATRDSTNPTQESLLESSMESPASSKPPPLLNVEIFDRIAYPAGSSGSNRSPGMNLDSILESPVVTSSSASKYGPDGDEMIPAEGGGSTNINQKLRNSSKMADAEQRISPERQNISPEEEFPSSEKQIAMEATRDSTNPTQESLLESSMEKQLVSPTKKRKNIPSNSKNTFDDAGESPASSKPPLLPNVEIFDRIAYPAGSSGTNRSSWIIDSNLESPVVTSSSASTYVDEMIPAEGGCSPASSKPPLLPNVEIFDPIAYPAGSSGTNRSSWIIDSNLESPVVTSSSASTYVDEMIPAEGGGSTNINQKAFKTPTLKESDRSTQGALRLPAKPKNCNVKDEEKTATQESQIELPILELPLSLPGTHESPIPQDTEDDTFSALTELELPPSLTLGSVDLLSNYDASMPICPFLKEFITPDSGRSSSGNSNMPTHALEHLPISPFLKDGITPDFGEPSGGKPEQAVSSNLVLLDGTLQSSEKILQITNDGLNWTNTLCITKEIKEIHFKCAFHTCSTKKVVLTSSDGKDVIGVRYEGNHNHSTQPTSTTSSQPPSSHEEKAQDGTRTTSEEYKWKRLRENKLQLGGKRGTLGTYCPAKKEEDKSPGGHIKFPYDGVPNHPPSSSAQKHNLELTLPQLPQEDVAPQGAELDTSAQIAINAFLASFVKDHKDSNHQGEDHKGDPRS